MLDQDPPWARASQTSRSFGQSTRTATAGDVDGDPLEEVIVVHVDREDAAHDMEITVIVLDDKEAETPYAETRAVLTLEAGVVDLAAVAPDLDGDGDADLVIGLSSGAAGKLLFAENVGGSFSLMGDATRVLAPATPGAELAWSLASGQLDHDGGAEVAAVLNEHVAGSTTGLARYQVHDDAGAGLAELGDGVLQVLDGSLRTAVVADVTFGDIDGDRRDEIVFAGLAAYTTSCEAVDTLYLALDDRLAGLSQLGAARRIDILEDCPDFSPFQVRFVDVNAVDLDDDGHDEIQANWTVFDNFVRAAPFTLLHQIPQSVILDSGDFGWVDANTMDIAVGDVSGDGRQDILLYRQDMNAISVWGTDAIAGFSQVASIPVAFQNSQVPENPVLVPVNLDQDSTVLRYSDGRYRLVFTQPIVIAAVAAAPCQAGIEQNHDGCYTTYGTSESQSVSTEEVLTLSASASVGINVDGGVLTQSELTIKGTLTAEASTISSAAYTLTRSVAYTSGPMEDSVIFTTIPMDQYTYTVVSHPDPALMGTEVVVSLPREPITLIAERSFYNDSLAPGALRIDEEVFRHRPGDLASYPTVADKARILSERPGLETETQSVGEGATSSVEIGLDVGREYAEGGSLALGFELDVEVTGGTILGGFTVGASRESTLMVTSGTETSYVGSVGSLGAGAFADHLYGFGLFTYVQADPTTGQQFEVLNYWIER
jgi:hypothetical protein